MEIFLSSTSTSVILIKLMMILIAAASLVATTTAAAASDIDPFTEALLGLKSQLIDASNTLHDWHSSPNASDVAACSWSGITCTENSNSTIIIISLDLSNRNLKGPLSGTHIKILNNLINLNLSHNSFTGELPVEIFTHLTNLRTLDISRNNFISNFPSSNSIFSQLHNLIILDAFSNSFSGSLPQEIPKLESLKVLNLAGSYFQGPIPASYGSFKSLEFLHLAGNLLHGQIPPELGNLKSMIHMEIGYNSYQGTIPWQIGNMIKLQYLDIAGANLSGSIPNHLSSLTNLETLFLFRNQLIGSIPWSFGNITTLINLDLSDNLLTGSIPESFSNLKNLRLLSLMYNSMSGSVPEGIAELPFLDTLLIWNNLLSGSLPMSLGKNSKLKWVDVSSNGFTGSIPQSICAGGMLSKLILFSNNFTGELSPALTECSSLVRLRLEDNSFSGEIPLIFNELHDIAYVDLSRNRFKGGIPKDIFQKESKLQYFNVSQNPDLGGVIPSKMWSLPSLENFSASFCNISGNLPPFGNTCKTISIVELNSNKLSGIIPKSVSNCKSVEKVNLASNNLTGNIPVELANLPSLSILDLSHNRFTGSVPQVNIFRVMGVSAFIGNPELCGAPLQPCSDSKELPSVAGFRLGKKSSKKVVVIWVLLLCSGVILFIVLSVLGISYLRKESRRRWKMVSFMGLPQFTEKDVSRIFTYSDSLETTPQLCKVVLPTGITVSVKKIEWETKQNGVRMSEFITLLGNARHKNLIRLLGFCCNKHVGYLLYECLPNGSLHEKMRREKEPTICTWATKRKIVIGIARGLCYLHHECYPPIPHGDLKASNVAFDENMEPHLTEFGLETLLHMNRVSDQGRSRTGSVSSSGELSRATIKEELCKDIYSFGEILLEILTNGRLKNAAGSIQSKPKEKLLREIYHENEELGATSDGLRDDEIKIVLEVALLCTRRRPSDRPSMDDMLILLLSGMKQATQKSFQLYAGFFSTYDSLMILSGDIKHSIKAERSKRIVIRKDDCCLCFTKKQIRCNLVTAFWYVAMVDDVGRSSHSGINTSEIYRLFFNQA